MLTLMPASQPAECASRRNFGVLLSCRYRHDTSSSHRFTMIIVHSLQAETLLRGVSSAPKCPLRNSKSLVLGAVWTWNMHGLCQSGLALRPIISTTNLVLAICKANLSFEIPSGACHCC